MTTVTKKERFILDRRLGKPSHLESHIHLLHLGRRVCSACSLCYDAVLEEKEMKTLKTVRHLVVSAKNKILPG